MPNYVDYTSLPSGGFSLNVPGAAGMAGAAGGGMGVGGAGRQAQRLACGQRCRAVKTGHGGAHIRP